ncbi:phosphatase PAP2 family protein [Prosthecochloris sp. N3]|uniref:Phosphatase PAP2 family protein n=1 Tax=Prosthecochloris ethylica TaxID=2743976 RepID=A0ABR9XPM0_9CHLB|nr:phosphatase PAP2 family protein [Prosthecochloris ethylica]MBF0586279.1 phosphatase PAP2 family protein [Prosthecochloris ethylica]MBF0635985.1 phosphatase PAP2 family protein [Prosthecochloris ethylica]NUK47340.1 phosphatase PAP2 family protein [Prosthecochloris ethylica]
MKGKKTCIRDVAFVRPNQHCTGQHYVWATLSVLILAFLHTIIIYAVVTLNLDTHQIRVDKYVYNVYIIYSTVLVLFICFYPFFVMFFVRPKKLVKYLINGYRWHLLSKERIFFSYPVLAIIPLDKSIYSSFKAEIPNINPFWLDASLCKLDRIIFLGQDPWRILRQIFSNPEITRVIDFLYHPLWISLLSVTVLFHALGRHSLENRLRFFLGYIIVWTILGNACAAVLSSAGPCYFSQITGQAGPYEELMRYLHSIQTDGQLLNAVQIQERLWSGHISTVLEYGGGISAMPSLHIATTALFALSMRHRYPAAEKMLYIYTLVIWIGSILLGWHYAVDGLVSVLCVMVIWYYSGKLTNTIMIMKKDSSEE